MAKKKKKVFRPWCWYCDRDFEDDATLIQHQRSKHFNCTHCNRKLNSASGMAIHVAQVHKETVKKVPNAIQGRDSLDIEIFGMDGIPDADLTAHMSKFESQVKKKQKTGDNDLEAPPVLGATAAVPIVPPPVAPIHHALSPPGPPPPMPNMPPVMPMGIPRPPPGFFPSHPPNLTSMVPLGMSSVMHPPGIRLPVPGMPLHRPRMPPLPPGMPPRPFIPRIMPPMVPPSMPTCLPPGLRPGMPPLPPGFPRPPPGISSIPPVMIPPIGPGVTPTIPSVLQAGIVPFFPTVSNLPPKPSVATSTVAPTTRVSISPTKHPVSVPSTVTLPPKPASGTVTFTNTSFVSDPTDISDTSNIVLPSASASESVPASTKPSVVIVYNDTEYSMEERRALSYLATSQGNSQAK